MFCHNWYFKNVGFKFEPYVCNKIDDCLWTKKHCDIEC